MLAKNAFKKTKRPLSTATKFERGRVIGLREGGLSSRDIAKRLGQNVSTAYDCWEQSSRDGTASRKPGSG
ncbi:uncharacterized protein TNCV_1989261 [Trichonephila clavipes]|nr:uncharacterized protein TNCV_1989261 [Trichonephila clavipes]